MDSNTLKHIFSYPEYYIFCENVSFKLVCFCIISYVLHSHSCFRERKLDNCEKIGMINIWKTRKPTLTQLVVHQGLLQIWQYFLTFSELYFGFIELSVSLEYVVSFSFSSLSFFFFVHTTCGSPGPGICQTHGIAATQAKPLQWQCLILNLKFNSIVDF